MADVSKLKINSTTYDIKDQTARDGKVDINQGTEHAGKFMKVNSEGKVAPTAETISVSFADITGDVTQNEKLAAALNAKITRNGSETFEIGQDAGGVYIWE